jgi:hypothetical protein
LEKKAAVDAKNKDDWTPLHLAAQNGHTEVVRILLGQSGIQVNAQTTEADGQRAPLHLAVMGRNLNCVDLLLEKGANASLTKKNGYIPLHSAIWPEDKVMALEIADSLLSWLQEKRQNIQALLTNETILKATFQKDEDLTIYSTFDEWKKEMNKDTNLWYKNLLQEYGVDVNALLATLNQANPQPATDDEPEEKSEGAGDEV